MRSSFLTLSLSCVALTLAGCAVGPNYQRPAVTAPVGFRDATNQVSTNSFADLPWWGVFKDPVLQDLIRVALTNNYDLRITLTQMDQARALQAQFKIYLIGGILQALGRFAGAVYRLVRIECHWSCYIRSLRSTTRETSAMEVTP